ncbi:ComEC/Rec2 family competence protein [Thalassobius sp. S69A]|uniref:ComEC/Rec2 family competence protein n=1 Tax=unclassified Thalassovita TaxID=2619711 RepID=UPI000C0DA5D2|nr:competence protein [Paracoccaceae bacterium]MBT25323.1 competence protein [Paracoccaceae bacterium]
MTRIPFISDVLLGQRLHLLPWAPVCLALGIGGYFLLPTEPDGKLLLIAAALALTGIVGGWRLDPETSPLFWMVGLAALGVCLASARTHMLEGPVLSWRYYGAVQGRVIAVDRSSSDALRVTLDRVVLEDVAPHKTPTRVRLSLHGDWSQPAPVPGSVVMLTGHLSPPNGPAEPGGFDFRRHAWFQQIGAVGYTRNPLVLWSFGDGGGVAAIRAYLSARIQRALPAEAGAFAAAVMTGDRSGMAKQTLETLRASNLAHLLAISGLHMGLLAGVVFGGLRLGFAAVPWVGLRLPAKKISALVALVVAAGYLVLSGGNIATERAFIMVAVMLLALVFNRRALSLRAVAVAAMVVLFLRPEALLSAGFQMSFAATTALVAVFGLIRDHKLRIGPAWVQPVIAVVISSVVAGAATAPFGAAHFNQVSQLGLIANLSSVPLMGVLVIPAGVIAMCLMPLGLEWIALWVMGLGMRWILGVADWVAGLEGAVRFVVSPQWYVLPLLTVGALIVALWQGKGRWAGAPICVFALVLWSGSARPLMLISEQGALVGLQTGEARALSRARGQGFVARSWLENDGLRRDQAAAAQLWPVVPVVDGLHVQVVRGKRAQETVSCTAQDWVISDRVLPQGLPCRVTDARVTRRTGALALYETARGIEIRSANARAGCRPWSRCPSRQ